jgi:phosphatidylglycerol lysyltransferase
MRNLKIHLKEQHYYFKEILAFLFIMLGIYFLRQQREELFKVKQTIALTHPFWLLLGIILVGIYILLQAMMYIHSFRSVGKDISIKLAIHLFLKRNLVSVFLPGGGVTSLAFFTKEIERTGISKTKINFASYIYGIIGIASIIVISIPVIAFTTLTDKTIGGEWETVTILIILLALIAFVSKSIYTQGYMYRFIIHYFPALETIIEEIQSGKFSKKHLLYTLLYSTFIEVVGIMHLYIAMEALGIDGNLTAAVVSYVVATLFLCLSPFMRGLGAVEISMVYVLSKFNIDKTFAISITFLYRLFEFWLPLVAGLVSFLFQKGNLILRVFPSVLLFVLGIVNIASVLTPAIASRLKTLHQFIPNDTIHFSNYMVLLIGFLLMICSAFLIKGLRNAWIIALSLSALSLIGHITKAIDYEEASLALFTLITLIATYKQYYIKGDRKLQNFSVGTSFIIITSVLIYGTIGFYQLKSNHFNEDFTLGQSVINTFACLVLLDTTYLDPQTEFAKLFIYSINIFGITAILLLFYSFVHPYIFHLAHNEEERQRADNLVKLYGKSPVDYFKVAHDKFFFFSSEPAGMISYKIANSYAIVLHEPICETDDSGKRKIISSFETFCQQNSVKPVYYRVDEEKLPFFTSMKKKALPIGQEAIVNLNDFTLEGKSNKSLRNALNNVQKKGFVTRVYAAPIKDGLLQKLKYVSDNWLQSLNREEMVFSQGMFDESELKNHTIITLENNDEKVLSFLNIIPDYVPGEITYDLIRKTADAPNGNMDCLIVALIAYAKENGFQTLNMGLAPFSGIGKPEDIPQRTIKFAYEKLQQFKHYKGLRDFKDKFEPQWQTKYLVYNNDYDLLHIPLALNKVMRA